MDAIDVEEAQPLGIIIAPQIIEHDSTADYAVLIDHDGAPTQPTASMMAVDENIAAATSTSASSVEAGALAAVQREYNSVPTRCRDCIHVLFLTNAVWIFLLFSDEGNEFPVWELSLLFMLYCVVIVGSVFVTWVVNDRPAPPEPSRDTSIPVSSGTSRQLASPRTMQGKCFWVVLFCVICIYHLIRAFFPEILDTVSSELWERIMTVS